jgi:LysR family glycine cleavage system transcriptional activator
MTRRPPLRSLAAFEAAARNGSFLAAAKELHVTTSAISHHIKSLEAYLSTRLFMRLNRGVRLTLEGAAFFESIHEAYERIDEGTQRLLGRPQLEVLTVRTGVSFGLRWLVPRLPFFLAENPGIDLRIVTPTVVLGAQPQPADVEIRYGPVAQPGMYVEPLAEEDIVPMCSPALLKGPRALRTPEDVSRFRLIESSLNEVTWSSWLAANHIVVREFSRLRFDNILLALQAAVSGLGIVLEGDLLAGEDLVSGRLVVPPALRDYSVRRSMRTFVVPETQARSEKVRLFRDWLMRTL